MTSFLPQVETTTTGISAGCVSGGETLFAVQSQIQKLNMLGAFHGLAVSLPLAVNVISLPNARPRGSAREAPSAKFSAEAAAFA